MKVTYNDYKHYNLKEEEYFRVGCSFFINCKDFDHVDYVVVQLRKPTLTITVCTNNSFNWILFSF